MSPRFARLGGVLFWLVWAWDVLESLVVLYFFCVGLADGSVSSFNIVLWLGLLALPTLVLVSTLVMQLKGWTIPALIVALLLALPGWLASLFLLVVIITKPRWN